MAPDAANSIRYYLAIAAGNKDDLARIRQWNNLKVGFDEHTIWVRDFDYAQIHSVEVKSIPFKDLFYERDNKLFFLDSRLPERSAPSLLWTAIDRALPVKLPAFNHNYFGIHEKMDIRFVPRETEAETAAMLVTLDVLEHYLQTAPAVRLQKIRWAILDNTKALLLGKPLLPIPGETFWQRKDFLIPTGQDLELFLLADTLQKKINPGRDRWVLWSKDSSYVSILKESLMPLSRSAYRLTRQSLSLPNG
ncbi:hypothetical protein [Chryseolinea soli]|uniref:MoxR-vWA-beta-propeller ternary system domain-containing protein n=1 Tax=Chryseolinea soli TaxID=2321403 RepID=A0A385SMW6_9BACT|nr:hypothetical protein [Chryseolinea soli]AYB32192.1 hypothetical protein D4L85_17145 [Chryseolinea soli]